MTLTQGPTDRLALLHDVQADGEEYQPTPFDLETPQEHIDGDRNQARVATRIQRCAEYVLMGLTWEESARRTGYASRGAAHSAVMPYLRRQRDETVAALRDVESARYNRAAAALWPKVLSGDARAQDTWLRNRAGFRSLHGLNAPLQVTLSSGAQAALADALGDAEAMVMGLVTARVDEPVIETPADRDGS